MTTAALRERLVRTYFVFDARSLGLFRITYATVLLADLFYRHRAIDSFYTNQGLLPNHTLLWAPASPRLFSLFFTASTHEQALALMLLAGVVFTALLVGYRTKLAQVLSLVALVSLNTRLSPLENGGDMVMNLLGVWSLFLPLGQRFSVDAVLRSLASRREHAASELNGPENRAAMSPAPAPYRSLAVLALILQFTVIYYFNVVHKTGPTWIEGTAVHYTLHQDRLVKAFGVFLREQMPFAVLRGLAYGAVVIEALGTLAIVSPFLLRYTRLFAVIAMPLLHLGFELCLDLGVFSFAMMSYFALLLLPQHWAFLRGRLSALHRRRIAFFDADCGICFFCARLLARLDLFQRIELLPNTERARLPAGVPPELLDTTILVVDAETGRHYTRARGFAHLLRALPGGFVLGLPLQLPGLEQLANVVYDLVARNRARISVFFGMAACGLPLSPGAAPHAEPTAMPAARFAARARRVLAEACVAVLMVSAVGEVVNGNAAVPRALRYRQPALLQAITDYPRLYQGWRMFAPHAPIEDYMIEVDAQTIDGRHVDPYNEVASRVKGPGLREIPKLLHQDQFFTAYSLFIWRPHFAAYHTAFREWLLRYHERTGNPKDRIVRFTVYKLSDESPPPGKHENTHFKREAFLFHGSRH